jgi:glycosyltransferase involved in cell wall biosynthesis
MVLPAQVDDVSAPSGGNLYDRRVSRGLSAAGWSVYELLVGGAWPQPDGAAREQLTRALARLDDDALVLIDGLVACGVPEVIVPQAHRLRIVVLVHLPLGSETGLSPDARAVLDARERTTLHAVHAVVATSPRAARELVEHHKLPVNRVHSVIPGVDASPPAPGTDGASHLLCVASVTPRKGHDLLLDALSTVADLPWTCTCVGALHHAPEHVSRLMRHELGGRVRFVGPRTGDALEQSYAAADLMVLASRAETYGMVFTEALARGIPIVATALDAVVDTVGRAPDGSVPGLLVEAAELPRALRSWLTEEDLRARLRASARARRGMLAGWEKTSARLATVLGSLRQVGPG